MDGRTKLTRQSVNVKPQRDVGYLSTPGFSQGESSQHGSESENVTRREVRQKVFSSQEDQKGRSGSKELSSEPGSEVTEIESSELNTVIATDGMNELDRRRARARPSEDVNSDTFVEKSGRRFDVGHDRNGRESSVKGDYSQDRKLSDPGINARSQEVFLREFSISQDSDNLVKNNKNVMKDSDHMSGGYSVKVTKTTTTGVVRLPSEERERLNRHGNNLSASNSNLERSGCDLKVYIPTGRVSSRQTAFEEKVNSNSSPSKPALIRSNSKPVGTDSEKFRRNLEAWGERSELVQSQRCESIADLRTVEQSRPNSNQQNFNEAKLSSAKSSVTLNRTNLKADVGGLVNRWETRQTVPEHNRSSVKTPTFGSTLVSGGVPIVTRPVAEIRQKIQPKTGPAPHRTVLGKAGFCDVRQRWESQSTHSEQQGSKGSRVRSKSPYSVSPSSTKTSASDKMVLSSSRSSDITMATRNEEGKSSEYLRSVKSRSSEYDLDKLNLKPQRNSVTDSCDSDFVNNSITSDEVNSKCDSDSENNSVDSGLVNNRIDNELDSKVDKKLERNQLDRSLDNGRLNIELAGGVVDDMLTNNKDDAKIIKQGNESDLVKNTDERTLRQKREDYRQIEKLSDRKMETYEDDNEVTKYRGKSRLNENSVPEIVYKTTEIPATKKESVGSKINRKFGYGNFDEDIPKPTPSSQIVNTVPDRNISGQRPERARTDVDDKIGGKQESVGKKISRALAFKSFEEDFDSEMFVQESGTVKINTEAEDVVVRETVTLESDRDSRGVRKVREKRSNAIDRESDGINESKKNDGRINESKKEDGRINESKKDGGRINESKKEDSRIIESKKDGGKINESKKDDGRINESKKNVGRINESTKDGGRINESMKDDGRINESKKDGGRINESKKDDGRKELEKPYSEDFIMTDKFDNVMDSKARNEGREKLVLENYNTSRGKDKTVLRNDKTATENDRIGLENSMTSWRKDRTVLGNDKTAKENDKAGLENSMTSWKKDRTVSGNDKTDRENDRTGLDNSMTNRSKDRTKMDFEYKSDSHRLAKPQEVSKPVLKNIERRDPGFLKLEGKVKPKSSSAVVIRSTGFKNIRSRWEDKSASEAVPPVPVKRNVGNNRLDKEIPQPEQHQQQQQQQDVFSDSQLEQTLSDQSEMHVETPTSSSDESGCENDLVEHDDVFSDDHVNIAKQNVINKELASPKPSAAKSSKSEASIGTVTTVRAKVVKIQPESRDRGKREGGNSLSRSSSGTWPVKKCVTYTEKITYTEKNSGNHGNQPSPETKRPSFRKISRKPSDNLVEKTESVSKAQNESPEKPKPKPRRRVPSNSSDKSCETKTVTKANKANDPKSPADTGMRVRLQKSTSVPEGRTSRSSVLSPTSPTRTKLVSKNSTPDFVKTRQNLRPTKSNSLEKSSSSENKLKDSGKKGRPESPQKQPSVFERLHSTLPARKSSSVRDLREKDPPNVKLRKSPSRSSLRGSFKLQKAKRLSEDNKTNEKHLLKAKSSEKLNTSLSDSSSKHNHSDDIFLDILNNPDSDNFNSHENSLYIAPVGESSTDVLSETPLSNNNKYKTSSDTAFKSSNVVSVSSENTVDHKLYKTSPNIKGGEVSVDVKHNKIPKKCNNRDERTANVSMHNSEKEVCFQHPGKQITSENRGNIQYREKTENFSDESLPRSRRIRHKHIENSDNSETADVVKSDANLLPRRRRVRSEICESGNCESVNTNGIGVEITNSKTESLEDQNNRNVRRNRRRLSSKDEEFTKSSESNGIPLAWEHRRSRTGGRSRSTNGSIASTSSSVDLPRGTGSNEGQGLQQKVVHIDFASDKTKTDLKENGTTEEVKITEPSQPVSKVKQIPPEFIIKPRRQLADEGESAKFKASCDGSPEPEVSWEFNKKVLSDGSKYKVYRKDDFHFLEVQKLVMSDAGKYTCVIRNSAGEASLAANLEVFESPKSTKSKSPPPVFETELQDVVAKEGDRNICLECRVKASHDSEVTWYCDGKVLKSGRDFRLGFDGSWAKLHFYDLKPEFAGCYECVVKNAGGAAKSSANLEVQAALPKSFPPKFTQQLKSQTLDDGERLVFHAIVTGSPEPTVKWFRNNREVTATEDVLISFDGTNAKLQIEDVLPEDSADFMCLAQNEAGEARTKASLKVLANESATPSEVRKEPPRFLKELKNIEVKDGDRVEMVVEVEGTPPIDVVWVRNDKEIPANSPDFVQTSEGKVHKLVIEEVFPEDSGNYVCEIYNDYGDCDSQCKLVVQETGEAQSPPEFIVMPKTVQTEEGSPVTFTCQVKGSPAPSVEWEINGKAVVPGRRVRVSQQGDDYRLDIPHCVCGDSGRYTCVVSNNHGTISHTASLNITPSPNTDSQEQTDFRAVLKSRPGLASIGSQDSIESVTSVQSEKSDKSEVEQHDFRNVLTRPVETKHRPKFKRLLQDQKTREGGEVTLECEVKGVPMPTIAWSVGGKAIKESKYFRMSYEDKIARLVIAEAYPEDEGDYMCTAENVAGSASCSCDLYVEEAASDSDNKLNTSRSSDHTEAPRIIEFDPINVSVKKGKSVKIRSRFSGEPVPKIMWFHNKSSVKQDKRVKIETRRDLSTLTVSDILPSDGGKYILVIENSAGSQDAVASVNVEDVPNPPAGKPHVSAVTKTSIILAWYGPAYDGGSQITNYRVEMCKCKEQNWKTLTSTCKNTSYQANNLTPDTEYQFRVSAGNKHGLSDAGQVSEPVLTTDNFEPKSEPESDGITSPEEKDELPFEPRDVKVKTDVSFEDKYDVHEELGKGKYGNVHRCIEKSTGLSWAAKIIKCREKEKPTIHQEIKVMNCLRHPKLLMLWDAYESPRSMVLVMEYIAGGELFERIIDDEFVLTERDCVHFMRQISDGVCYMHDHNILHLDLKPENILCISPNSNQIKIIDFGLARPYHPGESTKVMLGTPEFIAPEVINYDEIGFTTDMWSLGVVCYVLLSGLSPFLGDSDPETLVNVTLGEFDFDDDAFNDISNDAKDFIERLVLKNKEKRMTVHQCLKHKWLAQDVKRLRLKRLNTRNLKQFMARRKWQKLGNAFRALGRMAALQRAMRSSRSNSPVNLPPSESKCDAVPATNTDTENESSVSSATKKQSSALDRSSFKVDQMQENYRKLRDDHADDSDSEIETKRRTLTSAHSKDSGIDTYNKDSYSSLTDLSAGGGTLEFLQEMEDAEVVSGDVVLFKVCVTGRPEPTITWFKGKEEITPSRRCIMDYTDSGEHTLKIKDVTEADAGEYKCSAVNSTSQVICAANMVVVNI